MYLFAQVMSVFATAHQLPPDEMPALRGRLQNYQKLGIVKYAHEKGKRVKYSLDDVYKWGFALEFAEFGIEPRIITDLIWREWRQVNHGFYHKISSDWFIHFRPSMLRDRKLDRITNLSFTVFVCQEADLDKYFEGELRQSPPNVLQSVVDEFETRRARINISHVRRRIDEAIKSQVA